MKKVFISQPMTGKTKESIRDSRKAAIETVKKLVGKDCEFIDSYNPKAEDPLKELGRCLSLMADADIVYLVPGWSSSFGCSIERACALDYNIQILNGEV